MSESFRKMIRLAVIIFLSATVGILLGQFVSNYEMRFMLSREYCGDVSGIEIYAVGNVDRENFVKHLEMLVDAPEQLTECCDRMYFTGTDLEIPAHDSGLGDALGLTQDRMICISTRSFSTYVVFHELFHAYDNVHGTLSETAEFLQLYSENERAVPVFASHRSAYAAEFFAQAGALYLLMPMELSFSAPGLYEYYNNMLNIYN
ncbi:MAG: hypothetical protein J6O50_07195 [Ruminiclostridium sp.]|nr:hypothetical protein [Ruminiclostridium sp.]